MPVVCYFCNKSYKFSNTHNFHIYSHTLESPYRCVQGCKRSYRDPGALINHNKKWHGYKSGLRKQIHFVYKCYFCGKIFDMLCRYRQHLVVHTQEKPYKCNFEKCNKWLRDLPTLLGHELVCEFNPLYYKNLSRRKQQEKQTIQNGVLSCYFCGKSCAYRKHLYSHMRAHLGEDKRYCEGCGKTFDVIASKAHRATCQKLKELFRCKLCGVEHMWKTSLDRHIQSVHTKDVVNFPCYFCSKGFSNRTALIDHFRVHTKEAIKEQKCKYCSRQYMKLPDLMMHTMAIHPSSQEALQLQRNSKHSCYFCHKSFSSWSYLSKHMKCHTKEGR